MRSSALQNGAAAKTVAQVGWPYTLQPILVPACPTHGPSPRPSHTPGPSPRPVPTLPDADPNPHDVPLPDAPHTLRDWSDRISSPFPPKGFFTVLFVGGNRDERCPRGSGNTGVRCDCVQFQFQDREVRPSDCHVRRGPDQRPGSCSASGPCQPSLPIAAISAES